MSALTSLRGRIAAVASVIVLLLVAGVWVALTHTSAQGSATGGKPGARQSAQAPTSPLELVSETPASGATGVSGVTDITIHFSAPVAADSPMPTITPSVAGSWQGAGTSTLEFIPTAGFSQSAQVSVTIPGGSHGVRSAQGGVLGNSDQLSFQRTIQEIFRVGPFLGDAANAIDLSDLLEPGAVPPTPPTEQGFSASAKQ